MTKPYALRPSPALMLRGAAYAVRLTQSQKVNRADDAIPKAIQRHKETISQDSRKKEAIQHKKINTLQQEKKRLLTRTAVLRRQIIRLLRKRLEREAFFSNFSRDDDNDDRTVRTEELWRLLACIREADEAHLNTSEKKKKEEEEIPGEVDEHCEDDGCLIGGESAVIFDVHLDLSALYAKSDAWFASAAASSLAVVRTPPVDQTEPDPAVEQIQRGALSDSETPSSTEGDHSLDLEGDTVPSTSAPSMKEGEQIAPLSETRHTPRGGLAG